MPFPWFVPKTVFLDHNRISVSLNGLSCYKRLPHSDHFRTKESSMKNILRITVVLILLVAGGSKTLLAGGGGTVPTCPDELCTPK